MSRAATRVVTAATTLLGTLVLTAPAALAADYPIGKLEGEDRGEGLGTVTTLLLFVVLPVASAALLFAIVWLPGAVKANRYRPAQGWNAPPVWFAGPVEPVSAVESAEVGDVVRGGARGSW